MMTLFFFILWCCAVFAVLLVFALIEKGLKAWSRRREKRALGHSWRLARAHRLTVSDITLADHFGELAGVRDGRDA